MSTGFEEGISGVGLIVMVECVKRQDNVQAELKEIRS